MIMKKQIKKVIGKMLLYTLFLLIGGFLDVHARTNHMQTVTTMYYLLLSAFFVGRMSDRIVDDRVRKKLTGLASMMTLFFLLRGMKYHAFRNSDIICRNLWYLYYVPILLMALFSFLAALAVDEQDGERFRKRSFWLWGITGSMIVIVLTNDFHQFVFRFQTEFQNWDWDYQYGYFYSILAIWVLLLFVGTIAILFQKCRISLGKKLFFLPVLPILLGLIYISLYLYDVPPKWKGINIVELPETMCCVVACFWECCITIGLIPSNKGYEALFLQAKVAAQIGDEDGKMVYTSAAARELTEEQKQAEQDFLLDDDTYMHRRKIHGGFVYWQSDISEINRLNTKMEEIEERLSEEAELIRLQNEMQAQKAEVEEKNRLYDRIAEKVYRQSQKITLLTEQAEQEDALYDKNMKWVCFYGTYVKRCANFMLLAENNAKLNVRELEAAILESMHFIHFIGIPISVSGHLDGLISSKEVLNNYEKLEILLEQIAKDLKGVTIRFNELRYKVVLEGWKKELPNGYRAELEDGNLYVSFSLMEEGDVM